MLLDPKFAVILKHKQQVNAEAVCASAKQLDKLLLINEPGQNVKAFGDKVHDLAICIHRCGNPPDNFPSLVSKVFFECTVKPFCLTAIQLHDNTDHLWDTFD